MRRLGIVLGVASVLAIATARGSVHVAPTWEALLVAAAALVACLVAPERWARGAAIGAAVVAALAAGHVLFRPGMPQVHDPDHV